MDLPFLVCFRQVIALHDALNRSAGTILFAVSIDSNSLSHWSSLVLPPDRLPHINISSELVNAFCICDAFCDCHFIHLAVVALSRDLGDFLLLSPARHELSCAEGILFV